MKCIFSFQATHDRNTYGWDRERGVDSQRGFHSDGGGMIQEGFLEEVAFESSHEGWSGFCQEILEKVGRKDIPGRGRVKKGLCREETVDSLLLR